MKRFSSSLGLVLVAACLPLAACDEGSDDGGDNDGTPTADAAPGGPDAAPGDWTQLIAGDWSFTTAGEKYVCVYLTVPRTMYIGAIRPIAPTGTHHTVLSMGSPSKADGTYDCDAAENKLQWAYASGVGTEELTLPQGVGLYVEQGQQLVLNLHLFNTTEGGLAGTSGIEIKELAQADVVHEAEIFLPGTLTFQILPKETEPGPQSASGTCSITATQTIFAMFPHMHQLGHHLKTTVTKGGVESTIWDKPYAFDDQPFELLPQPIELNSGDSIETTCTWINTTSSTVTFGDSSNKEMCFSILMRYPRVGSGGGPAGPVCGGF